MIKHFVNTTYNHHNDVCDVNAWVIIGGVLPFPQFWVRHSNVRDKPSCGPFSGDNHLTTMITVSPQIWVNPRFHTDLKQWHESHWFEGNHFWIAQIWTLHIFLRVAIYLASNSQTNQTFISRIDKYVTLWINICSKRHCPNRVANEWSVTRFIGQLLVCCSFVTANVSMVIRIPISVGQK